MNVYSAIGKRRSVRSYKNDPVEKDVIEQIIKSATLAPSAKNRQPWKFIVFTGKSKDSLIHVMQSKLEGIIGKQLDKSIEHLKTAFENMEIIEDCMLMINNTLEITKKQIKDMNETLEVMESAPVIIAVLNTETKPLRTPADGLEYSTKLHDVLSIGAAIENLILRATEYGLGTLCIAVMSYAHDELQRFINTEHQIMSLIAVGHIDEETDIKERSRKPLDEVMEYRN